MAANVLSMVVTTSKRISNLSIANGQMIFLKDKQMIALDWDNGRKYYTSIHTLESDNDRETLESPIDGGFYFVIGTAELWNYSEDKGWIRLTNAPTEQIQFVGTELPELGSENKLYVNKKEKNISLWDDEKHQYDVITEKTDSIPSNEIEKFFK